MVYYWQCNNEALTFNSEEPNVLDSLDVSCLQKRLQERKDISGQISCDSTHMPITTSSPSLPLLPPPPLPPSLLPLLLTYFIPTSFMSTSFLRETYSSPAPLSSSTDVPVITSTT